MLLIFSFRPTQWDYCSLSSFFRGIYWIQNSNVAEFFPKRTADIKLSWFHLLLLEKQLFSYFYECNLSSLFAFQISLCLWFFVFVVVCLVVDFFLLFVICWLLECDCVWLLLGNSQLFITNVAFALSCFLLFYQLKIFQTFHSIIPLLFLHSFDFSATLWIISNLFFSLFSALLSLLLNQSISSFLFLKVLFCSLTFWNLLL